MSIENNIQKMVELLTNIDNKMAALMQQDAAPAPVEQSASPVAPQAQAPAPAAPPPVTQQAPTPATAVPFTDSQGMINYVMVAYNELGPEKGGQIQNVMTQLGLTNINDTKPEQYAALYQGIEALKGA